MQRITGIIKKKGRHAVQGYKDREFIIDEKGVFQYGRVGQNSKWDKKIKLSEVIAIDPIPGEPRHGFTLTKTDGRVLYFAAQTDEEKWKWITGFRNAIQICKSADWSPANEKKDVPNRQVFIPMLKLSKVTMTCIWRWRFFYIDDDVATYFGDPALGEQLGQFRLSDVTKATLITNKHNRDKLIQVDVSKPEKRSYFFSHDDPAVMTQFLDLIKPERKKGRFALFK